MSLDPLTNPLERLENLPTAMNWRGGWNATQQYYLNDVVISPATGTGYVLAGKTALTGGGDPSINADWVELATTTAGVVGVVAGAGITLAGTPTIPVVVNDGIITLTGGAGITIDTTTLPFTPQNPQIINTGILSLTNGGGISITGGQNALISSTIPRVSVFANATGTMTTGAPTNIPAGQSLGILMTPVVGNALYNDFLNGAPDANGTWLIDLSSFALSTTNRIPFNASQTVSINLLAQNLPPNAPNVPPWNNTYSVGAANGGITWLNGAIFTPPSTGAGLGTIGNLGKIAVNVASVRAAGITTFIGLLIFNNTGVDIGLTSANNTIFAEYCPNGII